MPARGAERLHVDTVRQADTGPISTPTMTALALDNCHRALVLHGLVGNPQGEALTILPTSVPRRPRPKVTTAPRRRVNPRRRGRTERAIHGSPWPCRRADREEASRASGGRRD